MSRITGLATAGWITAMAGWLTVTVLSQHPNRGFDSLRSWDRSAVILPNWRFFAPNPAQEDMVLGHRAKLRSGDVTSWTPTRQIPERTLTHSVWFPGRRADKGVFDVGGRLLSSIADPTVQIELTPDYRLAANHVRRTVEAHHGENAAGFQFCLARDPGYDTGRELEILFISRYEPLDATP